MREELLRKFVAYRLHGENYALIVPDLSAADLVLNYYDRANAVRLFLPEDCASVGFPTDLAKGKNAAFFADEESLLAGARETDATLVFCCTGLDSNALRVLFRLRNALGVERVISHSDYLLAFDYLYNTYTQTPLYQAEPEPILSSFLRPLPPAGALPENKLKGLDLVSLTGKKVIELGCLHCAMTNHFLRFRPSQLISVEVDHRNIAQFHAFRTTLRHHNLSLLVQDFHSLREPCDILLAFGVLYHSAHPLLLLEHLSTLADTIVVGSHVWSDEEDLPHIDLAWHGRTFEVAVTPEYKQSTGGICLHQTYVKQSDYLSTLDKLGFECTEVATTTRPNKRVYAEFVARRRD